MNIYHSCIAYCLVMRELSVTDFCCDVIIMKQDALLCLLVGFWHLHHKLKCIMCIILCLLLCDYIVLNLNFLVM